MYMVYVDNQLIYSSDMSNESTVIESPKLNLEVNNSGSFEFTIYPTHYMYDYIYKMKSYVSVLWDGVEIFYGRVLETETTIYGEKRVGCEGALAFLNDSVQPPLPKNATYTVTNLVTEIVNKHNSQIEDEARQFEIGQITVGGNTSYAFDRTSYQDSRSAIENIIETVNGFVRVRHENGNLYLDLLEELHEEGNQSIEFGVNMADLTVNDQIDDLFTAILPVGKNNLTIPQSQGGPILEDEDMIEIYGKIVRAVSFEEISDVSKLIQNGREYLQKNGTNIPWKYDITAVDLHYFDPTKDLLLPGRVVPILHVLDDIDEDDLICISCELDLQNPENNSYVIGVPDPFGGGGGKGIVNGSSTMSNIIVKKTYGPELPDLTQKFDELEISANEFRINTEEFEVRATEQFSILGLEVGNITGSDLWVNRDNITGISGVLTKDSNGNLHVKNGSMLYLDRGTASLGVYDEGNLTGGIIVNKINSTTTTAISGDKVNITANSSFNSIVGEVTSIVESALWQTKDNITAAVGTMTVDGQGNLHIKDGSGLYIDRNNTSLGVWDSGNLTAGVIVQKINGDSSVSIDGNRVNIAANSSFQAVASVAGNFTTDASGNVHVVNGSELYLGTGTASLKVYNAGNLAGGIIIDKINDDTTTTISGDKVDINANSAFIDVKDELSVQANKISLKANQVDLSATNINLNAANTNIDSVTTTVNGLISGRITASSINSGSFSGSYATFNTLEVNDSLSVPASFSIGGATAQLKNKQVVTGITTKTVRIYNSVTGQLEHTFEAIESVSTEWIRVLST